MRDPEAASHNLSKILTYCGENDDLWGTHSIWYGYPQEQSQALRAFQIAPEVRAKYGYPEMTAQLRARIFGLNAAKVYSISPDEVKKYTERDRIARERLAYL